MRGGRHLRYGRALSACLGLPALPKRRGSGRPIGYRPTPGRASPCHPLPGEGFWTKIKTLPVIGSVFISQGNQMARSTLLERRHLVQAYTWQGVPLTTALTRFTLGFQARLERLWEWETLIPKVTPLPQKSHFAIHCTSHPDNYFTTCANPSA